MGIPKFFGRWLRSIAGKRDGILVRRLPMICSSLSFDLNSIIHPVAQRMFAYGEHEDIEVLSLLRQMDERDVHAEFRTAFGQELLNYIDLLRAQDTLVLAVDGVAPMAKIQQQRQRRYRAGMHLRPNHIFDSNAVTPGTNFMRNLDTFLRIWIVRNRNILPPNILYTGHLTPGEGEHKIFEFFQRNEVTGDGAHVIQGLDADLIMLSLLQTRPNIFLFRSERDGYVNIDRLRQEVRSRIKAKQPIRDFVLMAFLIGNDFIPAIPSLEYIDESISTLIQTHNMRDISLVEDNRIVWSALATYLVDLAGKEKDLLAKAALMPGAPQFMRELANDDASDFVTFRSRWYQEALRPRGRSKRAHKEYNPVTRETIADMCYHYLRGMAWTLGYYTEGAKGISKQYSYPYLMAPLVTDLADYLSGIEIPTDDLYLRTDTFPHVFHQLLAVLPPPSHKLLPEIIRPLAEPISPIADMFPIKFETQTFFRTDVAFIPPADLYRISQSVSSIDIPKEVAKEYEPVSYQQIQSSK